MTSSFWRERNILVTGPAGFVGSWLTKSLLQEGANLTLLLRDVDVERGLKILPEFIRSGVRAALGDLCSYDLLERIVNEHEIQICFHLAAQTIVTVGNNSPRSTFESNIRGTWNLLEACRRSDRIEGVVVASSDKAYGEPRELPITEDHPLLPSHPYATSKACADLLTQSYVTTYGLEAAIVRCTNIYGGGDMNFSRVVPGTVRSVLFDENPVIRSDGKPLRDYMYISDAVNAYLLVAENLHGKDVTRQAFNFGSGKPIDVLTLVRKIIELAGSTHLEPKVLGRSTREITKQYVSTEKARAILGWIPKVGLEDGLAATIDWYKKYFHRPDQPERLSRANDH